VINVSTADCKIDKSKLMISLFLKKNAEDVDFAQNEIQLISHKSGKGVRCEFFQSTYHTDLHTFQKRRIDEYAPLSDILQWRFYIITDIIQTP